MILNNLRYLKVKVIIILIVTSNCFSEFKVIELDHVLDHNAPYPITPGSVPFSYEVIEAGNARGFWLAFGKYEALTHHGTHVVAPYFVYENGITVDQIPPERYFGEAAVIDIRSKAAQNSSYELSEQDVKDWIKENGAFPNNSFILVNSGWEKGRYPDQKAYFIDDRGLLHNKKYPGVSLGAMNAILDYEKKNGIYINGFGIDSGDLDVENKRFEVSALVGSLNKYIIVNLRNLESLPPRGAHLMVTPLKIRNAPGSQARVLARLPY